MTSPGGSRRRTLRVLYLEDDPRDAELTLNVLEEGGFVCEEDRVDTQEAFVLALDRGRPLDLILADYMVPGFDVQEALAIARRLRPDVPFILVSGKVGEETAIDMLHAGATDYVLKQRLARLVPAVERAFREKESEARYRSLFDHMSEGLAYCRILYDGDRPIDFVYLDVNPAFEVLTGLKGVVGKRVSEVIPGILESDPSLIERYARVARGSPERFQTYVESLGNWFDIAAYSPAKGDFVAAFDVITERKRAEELHASEAALREVRERELAAERAVREASQLWAGQLEQVNERLKVSVVEAQAASEREAIARGEAERREQEMEALFGSMLDGVIVYGENGRILKTNEAATRFFGTDVLGLTMAELIQRFDIRYSDETARAGSPMPEDRLPGRRALQGEVVEGARLRARTPGGLRDVLVSASPLYRDAAPWGALTVLHDVTDYERAVEAARRAEEQLRLSHDAIFVWHLQRGVESWNRGAEDLYGFASSMALRRNPQELLRTRFPWPREDIERELIRRRRWEGELVQTTEDGRTVVVSGKLQLIRYDGDDHVLEVNRDITDAKRAEDALRESERQLREADRRKDEFLAVLSHELRNPLAPIRNSLFVLDRAAPGGEQARHAKDVIERQVNQLTRLVADLLDVSRITRGKVILQKERIDLRDVVSRTLEDHRSVYVARGITLRGEQPGQPMWADADSARLAQALTNLLHNAAKYTKEGGEVVVSLRQEGDTNVLEVRDTGTGITSDELARIFEPFSQGQQALDRSVGGLGLGLALVKGLIELHRGTVAAHSDGIGKGAVFTLRIPAEAMPGPAPRPELKLVKAQPSRVLVIEDNVDAAETLKEALTLQGHEVALAFSGPEGLDKARSFLPELVLCDIGLPGLDGYEVARAFRADDQLHDIPLVAMTGYALSEDQKKAAEAGFDRHLAKPADLAVLERMLAELPGRRAG